MLDVKFTLHPFYLEGPANIRSTLEYIMTLFPRKVFNDTLPQIVLKHQLYSIHNDKTMVDKEVVRCISLWHNTFYLFIFSSM